MSNLSQRVNRASHPLLSLREGDTVELLVVTSDRGLCGAFNTNILRRAVEFLEEQRGQGKKVAVSVVGRKSVDFFKRRDWPIRQEWPGVFDRLSFRACPGHWAKRRVSVSYGHLRSPLCRL